MTSTSEQADAAATTPLPAAGASMGDCAIHYGGCLGWEIFPAPFGLKQSHKSEARSGGRRWGATADVNEIQVDFQRWHYDQSECFRANIGLATGTGSGVFVIETDTAAGHGEGVDGAGSLAKFEAEHGPLPPTLMAISPSGSIHRYFNHPGIGIKVVSRSNIMPGVDCKGDLGMVIAPPSVMPTVERLHKPHKPGGTYRWLNNLRVADAPLALLDLVCKPAEAATEQPRADDERTAPRSTDGDGLVWPHVGAFLAGFPTDGETLAMLNLSRWIPALFNDMADRQPGGGYRVTSKNLGRDLQEALSIRPDGIKDFGLHDVGDPRQGKRTPIELVMEHSLKFLGEAKTAALAAVWLRDQMRVPADRQLSWRTGEQESKADAPGAKPSGNDNDFSGDTRTPPPPPHTGPYIVSSAGFLADFIPPDYLIDGIMQRRFIYSMTAPTGTGKTAMALMFSVHVALGRPIGERFVEKGRVLYLAGENPDDIRMRWLAAAEKLDFNPNTIDVHFLPGVFKISEIYQAIHDEVEKIGPVALVVVDTSAAYYEGDDENANVQMGAHARLLRRLVNLPGQPSALVCCHPVKNATADNMVPKGGGSFLNEIDGNLTCSKTDSVVTLHWCGKFRGPDFAPLPFELHTVTTEQLKDSKGRLIPSVVATPLSERERREADANSRRDEDQLLMSIDAGGHRSMADHAIVLDWLTKDGKPYKARVQRAAERLKKGKLVKLERNTLVLTPGGKKEADRVRDL